MAGKSREDPVLESDDSSTGGSSVQDQPVKRSKKSAPEKKREMNREKKSKSEESVEETAESSPASGSEESDSSSGSESESESRASSQKGKQTKTSSPDASDIPREAFKPPSGFKAVKTQRPPSSAVSSILSNLRGKQVFHVTAPASLPLSSIKEVSLAKVMRGEPVLQHKGLKYGIPADSISQQDVNEKTLLLYDEKSQTYYTSPIEHIQSYHVQEMVNLPNGTAYNKEKPDASKPPRPQPKHLKMRFRPVGSTSGPPETIGTSSESEGETPTFKFPKGSKAEREERKRKHQQTEGDGKGEDAAPRKKSKKHASSRENGNAASSQTEPVPSSQDAHEERGRDKPKRSKQREETSQERKARREEKKRRKAEKAA